MATDRQAATRILHQSGAEQETLAPYQGIRRLAIRSNMSAYTVQRSIKRLTDAGWIVAERPEPDQGGRATSRYHLLLPDKGCTLASTREGSLVSSVHTLSATHDAYESNGIGPRGARLIALLRDAGACTREQIAAAIGGRPRTVRRHLGTRR